MTDSDFIHALIGAVFIVCALSGCSSTNVHDISGRHISAGCDPNHNCWDDCTAPEGTKVIYVDDPGAILPGLKGEFAYTIEGSNQVVMPKHTQARAHNLGWNQENLLGHEVGCHVTHQSCDNHKRS